MSNVSNLNLIIANSILFVAEDGVLPYNQGRS
jgi:hypothetical protein